MQYTRPLAILIEQFQKLPGIGPKSAQRMAFQILKMPKEFLFQENQNAPKRKSV